MKFDAWNDFESGDWQSEINVRDFIQKNYTPYEGDSSFLASPTEKTKKLWDEVLELYKKENSTPIMIDRDELFKMGINIISDNLVKIINNQVRHDNVRTALDIFTYINNSGDV